MKAMDENLSIELESVQLTKFRNIILWEKY